MSNTSRQQKSRGHDKVSRIPVKIQPLETAIKKPDWIRIKLNSDPKVEEIKQKLRDHRLFTVCEEASCPNLPECFSKGTATFMIMGDKCTRRCTFCDVAHGRPDPLDQEEPKNLATIIHDLNLKYVVITSVDRDDLKDGGAEHFSNCIREIRSLVPNITIEILVPDFRARLQPALEHLSINPPDVFNHNIETVSRLYKPVRPGSDYQWSLSLLKEFKARHPSIPTKSGLMLGLGETFDEVVETLADLRAHDVDMITIGQYLQPSQHHHPVLRYATPDEFEQLKQAGMKMGFSQIASGPFVRSSYHADLQFKGDEVT